MRDTIFLNATGTNTYTAEPYPTTLVQRGVLVVAKFANGNTGASTLKVNDGPAYEIWKDNSAVVSGAISSSYHYILAFDGLRFHIVGSSNASGGGGASNLNDLGDVAITAATEGDFLRRNGSEFVNTPLQASHLPSGIDATKISAGNVSNTEFDYLNGVTSALQTQLDGKAASSHTHTVSDISATGTADSSTYLRGDGSWATPSGGGGANALDDLTDVTISSAASGHTLVHNGTVFANRALLESDIPSLAASKIGSGTLDSARLGSGTANSTTWLRGDGAWTALSDSVMPSGIDALKIGAGNVSNTEFDTLNGVTSAIQTQLDGKASTSHNHVPPFSASDGNATISGAVTLTRDMYYDTITLASGGVLDPAGYRIFAKTIVQTGGKISGTGNSGNGNAVNAGGAGATALAAAVLGGGGAGGNGANGSTGTPSAGSAGGGSVTHSWGGSGASSTNGGAGGAGSSGPGSNPGAAGTHSAVAPQLFIDPRPLQLNATYALIQGGSGGGGGGAGGADGGNGYGGGGGGGGGRVVLVFCDHLDLSGASGVLIEAKGGNGANSTGGSNLKGGGGGGAGGGGGYVGLYVGSVTGSLSNAIDVSGGNGGNGGSVNSPSGGGRGGRGGDGGNADFYRADTGAWTSARSAGAGSGSAATAPSNNNGTTGGAGESVLLSI